jgi:hypothetical protein
LNPRRDFFQDIVANHVAMRVVHILKVVDID